MSFLLGLVTSLLFLTRCRNHARYGSRARLPQTR